ncbi:Hypothetical protein CINCED_3A005649 [Cinara cedri]|uniref:Reverse transcriptase domain n=1 Tax=Cinara cedri TaxID=506608 RepID=A0A5E4MJU7_9HEMI|nr:Hypothetical protein CINCED_3A005649 [Cinara cedri]
MLVNHRFQMFMDGKKNRWCSVNNGLLQESILAPALFRYEGTKVFNLYIHNLLIITGQEFQFADDIDIAHTCKDMKLQKKFKTKVNLVQKLAGTRWGTDASILRMATIALVYSTAKYEAPVWLNSVHPGKVDMHLNSAMRLISRVVQSTPVLLNITPPEIRRMKH